MAEKLAKLFRRTVVKCLFFRGDRVTDTDMHLLAALPENLGREPERASGPAGMAKEIKPPAVTPMEINRHYRHLGTLDNLKH